MCTPDIDYHNTPTTWCIKFETTFNPACYNPISICQKCIQEGGMRPTSFHVKFMAQDGRVVSDGWYRDCDYESSSICIETDSQPMTVTVDFICTTTSNGIMICKGDAMRGIVNVGTKTVTTGELTCGC